MDSQGNLIYFPNRESEAKRDDDILAKLKGVKGISDLLNPERKILQRDQRKQPKPEEFEPCGHLQKNDYNMLSNIIGKMSPEARNALIDALLKTLIDKSKVSSTKSNDKLLQQPLDAALQPPLRVDSKPDGPLVQPFSLTVEREKLRDLYKYLHSEKLSGVKRNNVMVNLSELLQETMKKEDCAMTKKPQCCHKQSMTKLPETQVNREGTNERSNAGISAITPRCPGAPLQEEVSNLLECGCDQYSDALPSGVLDFPGDKVINLTQIFNVHPKILIVHTGQLAPTDIRLLSEMTKPELTASTAAVAPACVPILSTTTTTLTPALNHLPTRSGANHRKCTRRHNCRQGNRHRYDRREHVRPIRDLSYTYYVYIDDFPPSGD